LARGGERKSRKGEHRDNQTPNVPIERKTDNGDCAIPGKKLTQKAKNLEKKTFGGLARARGKRNPSKKKSQKKNDGKLKKPWYPTQKRKWGAKQVCQHQKKRRMKKKKKGKMFNKGGSWKIRKTKKRGIGSDLREAPCDGWENILPIHTGSTKKTVAKTTEDGLACKTTGSGKLANMAEEY